MGSLEYQFDNQGKTTSINVLFNASQGLEYLNARINITLDQLGEGTTLDDLNRKQLEELARQKLVEIVAVKEEPAK